MCEIRKILLIIGALPAVFMVVACSAADQGQPAAASVSAYLEALVQKDENAMINQACAEWEEQARLEFDSFAAVEVKLEGPGCLETGMDGSITLVSCTGKLIASYGAEDLVIELNERTYQVLNEGGEWRMCGYR